VIVDARADARDARLLRKHQRAATRSLWRRPLAIVGLTIAASWILAAIFAPWLTKYGPLEQGGPLYDAPSSAHWFGTDELGRDVYSRVIYGSRITLPLALMLVALAASIGAVLGGIAGYFGGLVDEVIMRLADLVFAFPAIILAMAVAAALGPSLRNAVFAIVVVAWPLYARVTRGLVLSAREMDYVLASRLMGASGRETLAVEILPNIGGPVAVLAMLELGNAVLWLSGLSFLGLGAQPPEPEWGAMISTGAQAFDRWWIGTFPGLAILTAVVAFNFIGDSVRDALDPQVARILRRSENA
jgi:ABC-type dipeptide/oligopeptide/nickel transport system permease subunit